MCFRKSIPLKKITRILEAQMRLLLLEAERASDVEIKHLHRAWAGGYFLAYQQLVMEALPTYFNDPDYIRIHALILPRKAAA